VASAAKDAAEAAVATARQELAAKEETVVQAKDDNKAANAAADAAKTHVDTVQSELNCQWMFGDAGKGLLGFGVARLNPLRWSENISIKEGMLQLQTVQSEAPDRQIVLKVPSGAKTEQHFPTSGEAIAYLETACPLKIKAEAELEAAKVKQKQTEARLTDAEKDAAEAEAKLQPAIDHLTLAEADLVIAHKRAVQATTALNGTSSKDAYMIELLEKLCADESLQTYQELQAELLHRVQREAVLMDEGAWKEFEAKEDSVFTRVDQHKENLENKLDLYAEQFQKVHGIDHKTFTERWLLQQTGQYVELEGVLEKPSFQDLLGVYDIEPMTAYVASKMIIDDADFMGVFDLGNLGTNPSKQRKTCTYQGVAEEQSNMCSEQYDALTQDASARESEQKALQERVASKTWERCATPQAPMAPTTPMCCSTQQVAAHALGQDSFFSLSFDKRMS